MSFILHSSLITRVNLQFFLAPVIHPSSLITRVNLPLFLAHVIHPSSLITRVNLPFFLARVTHPSCLYLSLRLHFSLVSVIFFLAHVIHPSFMSLSLFTSPLQPYLCDLLLSTRHSSLMPRSLRLHFSHISVIFFLAHVIHPSCLSVYVSTSALSL